MEKINSKNLLECVGGSLLGTLTHILISVISLTLTIRKVVK